MNILEGKLGQTVQEGRKEMLCIIPLPRVITVLSCCYFPAPTDNNKTTLMTISHYKKQFELFLC